MDRAARTLLAALLAVELAWLAFAVAGRGGQRELFNDCGRDLFGDFWMPRICLRDGYTPSKPVEKSGWNGGGYEVAAFDRCYPPLAMLPMRPFPATHGGALCWAIASAVLFMLAMLVPARRGLRALAILPLSMPFLFGLERANTVWISVACVGVFLSWYESEVRWKRVSAALALSVAAVLKISPALLGVLYFNTRSGVAVREILLSATAAVLLFFGGFLFVPDGFGGLGAMLSNAAANADMYSRSTDFGLLPVWRAVRVLAGQDCTAPWAGMAAVLRISQAIGFAVLLRGCVLRDRMLVVGGMLMAAGNMLYYGMLYLAPVFLFWVAADARRGAAVRCAEALLWFAILCPLQIVVAGHPANGLLGAVAVLALIALHLVVPRPCRDALASGCP